LWRLIEEATDGGPADVEALGDLPLADPLLEEAFDLSDVFSNRPRPAVRADFLAGLGNPGLKAVAMRSATVQGMGPDPREESPDSWPTSS